MIEQPISAPAPLTELVTDTDHVHLSRLVSDGELEVDRIYRGREQIRGWGRTIEDGKSYPGIRHVTSNMRFVAGTDADGRDTAEGATVLTVFLSNAGHSTSTPWVVGEDHDRFVRTPDGWRFTHRSWVQVFSRA